MQASLQQLHFYKKKERENIRIENASDSFQLVGLAMTLLVAIILGAATGFFISMKKLFETIPDNQLFNDELFWVIAEDDSAGFYQPEVRIHVQVKAKYELLQPGAKRGSIPRRRSRARSTSKDLTHDLAIKTVADRVAVSVQGNQLRVPGEEGSEYLP